MNKVYYWVDFDGECGWECSITEECLIEESYEKWKQMLINSGHAENSPYMNVSTFIDYFIVNHWALDHEPVLS